MYVHMFISIAYTDKHICIYAYIYIYVSICIYIYMYLERDTYEDSDLWKEDRYFEKDTLTYFPLSPAYTVCPHILHSTFKNDVFLIIIVHL